MKKQKSPRYWIQNFLFNWKRFSKLLLKGNPGKIIFPDDRQNALQKLLKVGEKVLNQTLTSAFNTTTMEVIQSFKEFPEVAVKNTICTVPYIIRKIRDHQAMKNPSSLRRRHFKQLLRRSGNNLNLVESSYYLNTNIKNSRVQNFL